MTLRRALAICGGAGSSGGCVGCTSRGSNNSLVEENAVQPLRVNTLHAFGRRETEEVVVLGRIYFVCRMLICQQI